MSVHVSIRYASRILRNSKVQTTAFNFFKGSLYTCSFIHGFFRSTREENEQLRLENKREQESYIFDINEDPRDKLPKFRSQQDVGNINFKDDSSENLAEIKRQQAYYIFDINEDPREKLSSYKKLF